MVSDLQDSGILAKRKLYLRRVVEPLKRKGFYLFERCRDSFVGERENLYFAKLMLVEGTIN